MFTTYILYSENFDRYYIGHCSDIVARLVRHNGKQVPSTKPYTPWKIVYKEHFQTKAEANGRELEIKKKKSRKYIEFLINQKNNE